MDAADLVTFTEEILYGNFIFFAVELFDEISAGLMFSYKTYIYVTCKKIPSTWVVLLFPLPGSRYEYGEIPLKQHYFFSI